MSKEEGTDSFVFFVMNPSNRFGFIHPELLLGRRSRTQSTSLKSSDSNIIQHIQFLPERVPSLVAELAYAKSCCMINSNVDLQNVADKKENSLVINKQMRC